MQIILYNNSTEKIRVDKSDYLNSIATLDGTLRVATSLINPIITFELESVKLVVDSNEVITQDSNNVNVTLDVLSRIIGCNYAQIPIFNRYYYVTDIISVNSKLWQLTMSVDALMSFKDNIYTLNAFVSRNEYKYDVLVKDDMVSYEYDKNVVEYIPDEITNTHKNFSFKTTYDKITEVNDKCFVINFINTESWFWYSTAQSPNSEILPNVTSWYSGGNSFSQSVVTSVGYIDALRQWLVDKDKGLDSYVLNVVNYPFTITFDSSTSQTLKLGDTELSGENTVTVWRPYPYSPTYMVLSEFNIKAESFLDYDPYTTYDIFIPYLGWINVNADDVLNKDVMVVYVIDYKNGSAQVSLIDNTSNKIIYTSTTQLGIVLPISSTNQYDVDNNRISNNIALGLGLASSVISTVVGIATYNPVAMVGGVMGGAKSIASFVQNNNTNYTRASGSVGSGQSGVYNSQNIRIRKTSLIPKNYDEDYASLFGKPLNQYLELSTLKGYTVVGEVHVHNIPNATNQEIESIESLLKQGIIL